MKKALSLFLSLALMAGLCLPAAAAQSGMDEALTQVTVKVKQTLDIADTYDTFYGELSGSGENTYWSLNWSGETAGSLMVEADESGKVMSYYRRERHAARLSCYQPCSGTGHCPGFSGQGA